MTIAFIFPGQGSQAPGMGKTLHDAFGSAREVFQEIDEALGEKLSRLIFEGPADELTLTANAQPALMAVSLAAMRALEREFGVGAGKAAYVAGHSLGEYSALAAAGALSVSDAARLLRVRGNAMQAAVPVGEGAMAALIGKVDVAIAEQIALEGSTAGTVVVANDNNAGNVVISGTKAGVEAAIAGHPLYALAPANAAGDLLDEQFADRRRLIHRPRRDVRHHRHNERRDRRFRQRFRHRVSCRLH